MANPDPYNRTFSFNDFQASNPSSPLPGTSLDNELENVELAINGTQTALEDIRRSDGALKNGIVTVDSLDPIVAAGVGSGALASAEAAAASADAASDSAEAAASSAGAASGYAGTAATSAGQAMTFRNEAETEKTLAQTARTGAQTARDYAAAWSSAPEGQDVNDGVNPVNKSSYHWAQVALGAATGALPDGSVTTPKLANGVLSADTTGRAKMADGFVTEPKLDAGVAAKLNGALQAANDLSDVNDAQAAVANLGILPHDTVGTLAGRVGEISTISAAIRRGSAKVVFWGDSITEGTSHITYQDSFPGLIARHLMDTVTGVVWEFENYSIAGYAMTDAANPAFPGTHVVGATMNPPVPELWPDGDTPSKAWREWVKDAEPDLLVIAFGMNAEANPNDFATALTSVLTYIGTWTKIPSVVIVTPPLSSRTPSLAAPWADVQGCADAARGVALRYNLSLIDANALYRMHLDGVDVLRTRNRFTVGFEEYGDWTLLSGAAPTLAGGTLQFAAAGRVSSAEETQNIDLSIQIDLTTATEVDLYYRTDQPAPDDGYVVRVASDGTVTWFNKYTPIYVTSITPNSTYRVIVRAFGARHEIWVNGVKLTLPNGGYHFAFIKAGKYGIGVIGGAANASNFYGRAGYAPVLSGPRYTEAELLGVDDWLTNPDSIGGSGINHPSSICYTLDYLGGAAALLGALALAASRPSIHFDARWATSVSATNKITGFTKTDDPFDNFNWSTGRFTAPRAGIYVFSFHFLAGSGGAAIHLYINEAQAGCAATTHAAGSAGGTFIVKMNGGDTAELYVTYGSPEVDERYNHFSGFLLN